MCLSLSVDGARKGRDRAEMQKDELRHDVTDELAAYKLAQLPFPGDGACPERSRRSFPRLLPKRSAHQECVGEKVDRFDARETRPAERSRVAAEDLRQNEVTAALLRRGLGCFLRRRC